MDNFFEKKDLIIIELATYILDSNESLFSLGVIAKRINVDRRALVGVVDEYHYLGLNQSGLHLTIDNDQLAVTVEPVFTLTSLSQLIFRNTLLFNLCDSLFNRTFTTLVNFANDHFISLSSIYRRVNKLRSFLKNYHIGLDFSDSRQLIADEKQIRHFFFELYTHAYGLSEVPIVSSLLEYVSINRLLKETFSDVPLPILQKIKLMTYIYFMRLQHGFYIVEDNFIFDSYDIQLSSRQLKEFIAHLIHNLSITEVNISKEAEFFSFYLQTIDVIALEKFDIINIQQLDFDNPYLHIAREWISKMTLFFNISLSASEYFFLLLNLHYHYIRDNYLQQASRFNTDKKIMTILKKDNLYIFNKTNFFLNHLSEYTHIPQTNALNYLYYLLIHDVLLNSEIKINLCVFSSLFHSQKVNIEKRIEQLSPILLTFKDNISDNNDLIIADFNRPSALSDSTIPWLTTNTFPTHDDYDVILSKIFMLYNQNVLNEKE